MRLGEALDKRERLVGDLAPTAVDRERMPAVRDPRDLGGTGVPSLLLVRRVDDRPRHRVILLAGYEEQRAALGTLAVDLRLGPRIEVGARGLEQRRAGGRDVETTFLKRQVLRTRRPTGLDGVPLALGCAEVKPARQRAA